MTRKILVTPNGKTNYILDPCFLWEIQMFIVLYVVLGDLGVIKKIEF